MKKSFINTINIEGLLYEHTLDMKTTGPNSKAPGTEYISGEVKVATDDKLLNIITVRYSYVTESTSTGKTNRNYNALKSIMEGSRKTVMKDGADKAAKVRIASAVGLNEFYNDNDELVSAKINDGGFITFIDAISIDENRRSHFETDMVITNFVRKEADPEKGYDESGTIKGAIFNFRKTLMPVEYRIEGTLALDYFEGLNVSAKTPIFTKVWGNEISTTVVKKITEENAFGEPYVREVPSSRKAWIVTGASPDSYEWDDESTLTADEFTKMIAEREVYLATLKKKREEYKASKGATTSTSTFTEAEFKF